MRSLNHLFIARNPLRGLPALVIVAAASLLALYVPACDEGPGGGGEGGWSAGGSEQSEGGATIGGGGPVSGGEPGGAGSPGGETTTEGEPGGGTGEETPTGSGGGEVTGPQNPTADSDGDGIYDINDNCPLVANPGQEDLDGDGIGDACDPDIDGDGSVNVDDCEPFNPNIHPGKAEICNGIDDNCNGIVDDDADGCVIFYVDADGDNAGAVGSGVCLCAPNAMYTTPFGGDCNDNDATIHAFAPEICDNKDNNCNNLVDEGCDDDSDGWCDANMIVIGTPPVCPFGGGDCFDDSPLINPGMAEIPGDGWDNNCDGKAAGEPSDGFNVVCPENCLTLGTEVQRYLCAMEMCFDDLIGDAFFFSPTGDNITSARAVMTHYGASNNDLAPFAGGSYCSLASGPATGTSHSVDLPGGGSKQDPFSSDSFPTYDNVEFTVNLTAPPGAVGFSIDYIFMSVEYMEYVGTTFNDKFYIILDDSTVINYTACSKPNQYYDFIEPGSGNKACYIAINTAFSEVCNVNVSTNINGTGFSCAGFLQSDDDTKGSSTGWLTTTYPIQAGQKFKLTFHIHDTSDGIYDSLVLLDNFKFITDGKPVKPGTTTAN